MTDYLGPTLVVICWATVVWMICLGILNRKATEEFLKKKRPATIVLGVYVLLSGGNIIWDGITDWGEQFHWLWSVAANINGCLLMPGAILFLGWRAGRFRRRSHLLAAEDKAG